MRMTAIALAALALAACGGGKEAAGDFNGRVEGSVEGVMRGTAWFCDGPRGAMLVMDDERRGARVVFQGPPGSVRTGAWLLSNHEQPGGFVVHPELRAYPDPDAERLDVVARGGTLTLDTVSSTLAAGRYQAQTVTVDVEPKNLGDGRVSRIPNRAGLLAGFFRATRRAECPARLDPPK